MLINKKNLYYQNIKTSLFGSKYTIQNVFSVKTKKTGTTVTSYVQIRPEPKASYYDGRRGPIDPINSIRGRDRELWVTRRTPKTPYLPRTTILSTEAFKGWWPLFERLSTVGSRRRDEPFAAYYSVTAPRDGPESESGGNGRRARVSRHV